ncbi:TPA: hypothetical protein ACGO1T_001869 [Streptococcus suis]
MEKYTPVCSWQPQEEMILLRQNKNDKESKILKINATVWYSEEGGIMAIEPFTENSDGEFCYHCRIIGLELANIHIFYQGLLYKWQQPCNNALKYPKNWNV